MYNTTIWLGQQFTKHQGKIYVISFREQKAFRINLHQS